MIVLIRLFRIEEIGILAYLGLNPCMYEPGANQPVDYRNLRRLLPQSPEIPLFVYICTVYFTHIVIITMAHQRIAHYPAVFHPAKAWLKINIHVGVRPSCGMLRLIPSIPGRRTQGKTAFPFLNLAEPWHICPCGPKKTVKHDGAKLCLPCVGYQ